MLHESTVFAMVHVLHILTSGGRSLLREDWKSKQNQRRENDNLHGHLGPAARFTHDDTPVLEDDQAWCFLFLNTTETAKSRLPCSGRRRNVFFAFGFVAQPDLRAARRAIYGRVRRGD